jgi:Cys-rich protein (TIGR01571 family)
MTSHHHHHHHAGSAPLTPDPESLPMMIHVTAPATLSAGYTFEAEINGDPKKVFTVAVPEGGVHEGEIFLAPLPDDYNGERLKIPTGRWKDGIFDCFSLGLLHPSLCCSLWCTPIAMAQTISRLNLTWLGEPGTYVQAQKAFSVIVALVVSFIIYSTAMSLAAMPFVQDEVEVPQWMPALRFTGNFLFTVWSIYSLCRTRESLRARMNIPERDPEHVPGCVEDLCCSIWCSCCVTAQMLRHTGEYETHPGSCCSKTGHPLGTPTVV